MASVGRPNPCRSLSPPFAMCLSALAQQSKNREQLAAQTLDVNPTSMGHLRLSLHHSSHLLHAHFQGGNARMSSTFITGARIFPCTNCGEMIYSDSPTCRFCSAPVNRQVAEAMWGLVGLGLIFGVALL